MGNNVKKKDSASTLSKAIDETTAELEGNEEQPTEDELTKALNDAVDILEKASPPAEDDMDEDEYGEEEEEEKEEKLSKKKVKKSRTVSEDEGEPDFDALSKSIPDEIEADEEAADVLDAVPFVKALVDAVDSQIEALLKAVVQISDRVGRLEHHLTKTAKLEVVQAKMVKSIRDDIKSIGDAPLQRKGVINAKELTIMRKAADGGNVQQNLSKADALTKLTELVKSKKITILMATNCESRIQKGQPLPPDVETLLLS